MKMFGLAAIAAVAAMAFVGAGTASAEGIAICKKNELPCPVAEQVSLIHATLEAGTVGRLLTSLSTILCLEVLAEAHVEGALLQATTLNAIILVTFGKCGSNAAHSNCASIATTGADGLANLTKNAANLGTIKGTLGAPGSVKVQCTLIGFPLDCDYGGGSLTLPVEGAGHAAGAGNGRFTANESQLELTATLGGIFCPPTEVSKLDAKLISLNTIFITG